MSSGKKKARTPKNRAVIQGVNKETLQDSKDAVKQLCPEAYAGWRRYVQGCWQLVNDPACPRELIKVLIKRGVDVELFPEDCSAHGTVEEAVRSLVRAMPEIVRDELSRQDGASGDGRIG